MRLLVEILCSFRGLNSNSFISSLFQWRKSESNSWPCDPPLAWILRAMPTSSWSLSITDIRVKYLFIYTGYSRHNNTEAKKKKKSSHQILVQKPRQHQQDQSGNSNQGVRDCLEMRGAPTTTVCDASGITRTADRTIWSREKNETSKYAHIPSHHPCENERTVQLRKLPVLTWDNTPSSYERRESSMGHQFRIYHHENRAQNTRA